MGPNMDNEHDKRTFANLLVELEYKVTIMAPSGLAAMEHFYPDAMEWFIENTSEDILLYITPARLVTVAAIAAIIHGVQKYRDTIPEFTEKVSLPLPVSSVTHAEAIACVIIGYALQATTPLLDSDSPAGEALSLMGLSWAWTVFGQRAAGILAIKAGNLIKQGVSSCWNKLSNWHHQESDGDDETRTPLLDGEHNPTTSPGTG
jgi:hypothetical protein